MNDLLLTTATSSYYAQLERRLEQATNLREPEVRRAVAQAAFDLVLAASPATLRGEIEPHREACVTAVLAEREAMTDALHSIGRRLPRSVFTGPVNTCFQPSRRINMVLVTQPGPVATYALQVRAAIHNSSPVLDLATTTWADLADRNGLLYGTPAGNPLVGQLLAESGWEVTKDHIAIGDRKFEGENLVLIACRSRPNDVTLCDVIYTGYEESSLIGINLLHHGPSDFVIGRQTKPGKYQILTRGNFAKGPRNEPLTRMA